MTRKHFEAIAEIFRSTPPGGGNSVCGHENQEQLHSFLINEFANYLATTNEFFDRARFLTACREDNNQ